MNIVKVALLGALTIAAVACGGGATPTPAGASATPAGASATPAGPAATATTGAATSVPGQSACALITQAEMDIVFGGTATIESQDDGTCSVTGPDSMIPIVIRYGDGETIEAAKMVVDNGVDLTIAGSPAFYGELMGGILYVEKNGQTLVLQAPLSTESKDALIAAATVALARFP